MSNSERSSQEIIISDLAQRLGLTFKGDGTRVVSGVSSFESASKQHLCFLQSSKYVQKMKSSGCQVVIVPLDFDGDSSNKTLIYASNPHLSFVQSIDVLLPLKINSASNNIHPSASIAATANIGSRVKIGANCVIDEHVTLSDDVSIGAGCIVDKGSTLGAGTQLFSGVVIRHDVQIGSDVIIQSGAVIGSDGFGLVYDQGRWINIPQLGRVIIGDKVEIGANTTIDRGALDDTVIEDGVKLDNLIQVAHNVRIGENTAIAACVGIAGSAIIGKSCQISGACTILGHLEITDNVTVTAMSMVTKSIKESGIYSSGTPLMENRLWHRNNVRYKSLDDMSKKLSELNAKMRKYD